ncbi:MAG: inorganic phosphate transporter [Planctomycetota bacterium]
MPPPLIAEVDWLNLSPFLSCAAVIALVMLLWDTVEVGRNDAANLINAVFGARVLTARKAVMIAAMGVILGAALSSPVMETARKGIFDPGMLTLRNALCVYIAVYIVDTVLLYGYSAFGMPLSTTACLVFELLGASFALAGSEIVHWDKARQVVFAIVASIFISGVVAFFVQRAVRGAIRDRTTHLATLLAHGGWVAGGMLAGLTYFMLVKGLKHVGFVKTLNQEVVQAYGPAVSILFLWGAFAIIIHLLLVMFRKRVARHLFSVLAIIGMLAMAFAFGQNDLANCASPGLSALHLIRHSDQSVAVASEINIPTWMLLGCGVLMVAGMLTRNARRVTSAAVHTGSMSHNIRLYAPRWCLRLARFMLRFRRRQPALAPPATTDSTGKRMHYDVLRAAVILSVSASVIATASGFGLPVSTTYVAFAAVIATGMADRILQRGDADLKLARTIWVVFSWFAAAVLAAVCAGVVSRLIFQFGLWGMGIGLVANMTVRFYLGRRADRQEERVRVEARERRSPELFVDEDES